MTKSAVAKQARRERLVKAKWDKRQELKGQILDMSKSEEERMAAVDALNKMPKNSSRVRLRNRCQFTGRHAALSAFSSSPAFASAKWRIKA